MPIKRTEIKTVQVKFESHDGTRQVARASGVVVYNELHERPYMLLEDVFVAEDCRGQEFGEEMVDAVAEEARARGCYTVKAVVNNKGAEANVTLLRWYRKLGFRIYAVGIRMDLA